MSNWNNKSIIAMKGHPYTRKTEFARGLAAELACPVLSIDDFLKYLIPASDYKNQNSSTCTPVPNPQDLAFQIICEIARSHLSFGISQNVVIDSRLSSKSHLDQLIQLADSVGKTRLVIVESKTDNIYQWQTQLETGGIKNWEDVEFAIRGGFDERSQGYTVPKLVLDPLSPHESIQTNASGFHFPYVDAVTYMITRNEGDGPDVVVFQKWLHGEYDAPSKKSGPCKAGHYITNYSEEGLDYQAECRACGKQVMGAAYTCNHCSFVLHKQCAELLDDDNVSLSEDHTWSDRYFMYDPSGFRCASNSCVDSTSCDECFFTSHLKCRLLPTVVRHDCDEHFLSVVLSRLNDNETYSKCAACGDVVYKVWYCCRICCVVYHHRCLTKIAPRVEHQHGGHRHHMLLQYSSKDAEDYICDVCFEREIPQDRRDPACWFYSCQDCPYVAHLRCTNDGYFFGRNPLWNPVDDFALYSKSNKHLNSISLVKLQEDLTDG